MVERRLLSRSRAIRSASAQNATKAILGKMPRTPFLAPLQALDSARHARDPHPLAARRDRPSWSHYPHRRARRGTRRPPGAARDRRVAARRAGAGSGRDRPAAGREAQRGIRDRRGSGLPNRSDPAHCPRSRHRRRIPPQQSIHGRAADDRRRRGLWPWRDGAAFRRRHRIPHPDPLHRVVRAGDRGNAVLPVGSGPQDRPVQPLAQRDGADVQIRSHHPHRHA